MSVPNEPRGEGSLRREIGVLLGVFLVINATIGTGIFKKPAEVARLAGSLDMALLVWAAGGLIALCGALAVSELAAAMPRTGGIYEYLRRAYGPSAAFLFGWAELTLLMPSAVGSFAKLAAEALADLLGFSPDSANGALAAVLVLLGCAAANLIGVKTSATAQALISAAKYAGVVLLALAGLLAPLPASQPASLPAGAPAFNASPTFLGFAAALVAVMWAYDGWADLSRLSGEVRAPERSLPRALLLGTLAIVAIYLLTNLGYARALGLDGLRASTTGENMAAANVATRALGDTGRRFLSALILLSCVGGCMSSLLTGSRIFVPMSADGLFWRGLGAISPRANVPARAVIIGALLGAGYVTVRSFEQLTDAFVVGFFPFYMLAVAAVFVLRRREPALARPFKVPGYPITPLVFLLGAAALMTGALLGADKTAFFALGILAAGFPVHWLWKRLAPKEPEEAPKKEIRGASVGDDPRR